MVLLCCHMGCKYYECDSVMICVCFSSHFLKGQNQNLFCKCLVLLRSSPAPPTLIECKPSRYGARNFHNNSIRSYRQTVLIRCNYPVCPLTYTHAPKHPGLLRESYPNWNRGISRMDSYRDKNTGITEATAVLRINAKIFPTEILLIAITLS